MGARQQQPIPFLRDPQSNKANSHSSSSKLLLLLNRKATMSDKEDNIFADTDDDGNDSDDTAELFDWQQDPYELHNLVNQSEMANVAAKMHKRLHALRQEIHGPERIPNTRCDPLLPAGTGLSDLPNCSKHFPNLCCEEQKE